MRVTQALLRKLRSAQVYEQVTVHYRTEKEVLQLLKLIGVGDWYYVKEEPGRWSVWRVD